MSEVVDPGKDARRAMRQQRRDLLRQKQIQKLEKAEAESELAAKKALATSPTKGRRGLITPVETGRKQKLG